MHWEYPVSVSEGPVIPQRNLWIFSPTLKASLGCLLMSLGLPQCVWQYPVPSQDVCRGASRSQFGGPSGCQLPGPLHPLPSPLISPPLVPASSPTAPRRLRRFRSAAAAASSSQGRLTRLTRLAGPNSARLFPIRPAGVGPWPAKPRFAAERPSAAVMQRSWHIRTL